MMDARRPISTKATMIHAFSDYSEAIKMIPKNAISYANRGTIYSQKGDFCVCH